MTLSPGAQSEVGVPPSGEGMVLLSMLGGLSKDQPSELRPVVAMVAHALIIALKCRERNKVENKKDCTLKLSASVAAAEDDEDDVGVNDSTNGVSPSVPSRVSIVSGSILGRGPSVLADDDGHFVKMVCPSPSLVQSHSTELADMLRAAIIADNTEEYERENTLTLEGPYSVWQEVKNNLF